MIGSKLLFATRLAVSYKHGIIVAMATLAAACGGAVPAAPAPEGQAAWDGSVTRTIVRLSPHGNHAVTTETISALEHQRELDAREALLKARTQGKTPGRNQMILHSGCAASSLWIFDNTGNTVGPPPLNHEICFFQDGHGDLCADLSQYAHECISLVGGCDQWASSSGNFIGSYWAGSQYGVFAPIPYSDGDFWGRQWFQAWERQDDAQSLAPIPHAQQVCIYTQ